MTNQGSWHSEPAVDEPDDADNLEGEAPHVVDVPDELPGEEDDDDCHDDNDDDDDEEGKAPEADELSGIMQEDDWDWL